MSKRKEIIFVSLGIVLILILISIIIHDKPVYKNTDGMISIYLQDINGEYHKQERREFPKEGYSLDKAQSYCENESKIYYKESKIKVKGNKTDKCYIYFTNDNIVRDLSGNHYDGVIQNGGKVQIDEEGNQGLYFDGVDDFVDIVDLPETINWADGFQYEFEAKWLAFNYYSRIFDFGNGANSDNVFFSTCDTRNAAFPSSLVNSNNYDVRDDAITNLEINKIVKVSISYEKTEDGFVEKIYKDGILLHEQLYTINEIIRNITRTTNYLGKSNWSDDAYFDGYIYNLKITDAEGNVILWYDFTEKLVKDLSENNYNGFIQNGGIVKIDEEGNQGLYFDGLDDYVDIVDLPEIINWEGGFTIEFEAKWLAFNFYSRILDFGNGAGSDSIVIANNETSSTMRTDIFKENIGHALDYANFIELQKFQKIKIETKLKENSFIQNVYKNDELIDSRIFNSTDIISNALRTTNYLGKSNWSDDAYFDGYIYNLKITDAEGNIILWYDFT